MAIGWYWLKETRRLRALSCNGVLPRPQRVLFPFSGNSNVWQILHFFILRRALSIFFLFSREILSFDNYWFSRNSLILTKSYFFSFSEAPIHIQRSSKIQFPLLSQKSKVTEQMQTEKVILLRRYLLLKMSVFEKEEFFCLVSIFCAKTTFEVWNIAFSFYPVSIFPEACSMPTLHMELIWQVFLPQECKIQTSSTLF